MSDRNEIEAAAIDTAAVEAAAIKAAAAVDTAAVEAAEKETPEKHCAKKPAKQKFTWFSTRRKKGASREATIPRPTPENGGVGRHRQRSGFTAVLTTMITITALVLSLVIITIKNNAASDLPDGTQEQFAYQAELPDEHEPVAAGTTQSKQPEEPSYTAPPSPTQAPDPTGIEEEPITIIPPSTSTASSASPTSLSQSSPTEQPSAELSSGTTGASGNPDSVSSGSGSTNDNMPDAPDAGGYDGAYIQGDYPTPDKVAYLTIDDGPSREITPGILDVLLQEGVKATFFVLPHSGVADIYQRILDEGHEIGNHSYSHNYSNLYSSNIDVFTEDVLLAQDFMYANYGYMTTSYRFPGGAMSRSAGTIAKRREVLEELGYRDFDWNVDTGDANTNQKDKSAAALTRRVLDNTRGRAQLIVLMHDTKSKKTTLEALPYIIAGLREQGYTFDVIRNY